MNLGIFVYDVSLTGGAEHVAINLAEELSKHHNVYMISLFTGNPNSVIGECSYTNISLNAESGSITRNFFKYSSALKKCLKKNNIDILMTITAGVITVAVAASKGTKTKVIYTEHSNLENKTYGKKHELRQLLGAKFSDYTVTLTERDKKNFLRAFKIPEKKICAIPNWYVNQNQTAATFNPDSKKIVSVGRLEKVKGYDYLIEVAKLLANKHSDWHWDIYGDGTLREQLENDIKANGLETFITLMGNVSNISQRLPDYSIFVMTSKYEGIPLSLLEAQSAHLPIVSFDCPTGPDEIVENEINGYLIPTYDVNKMAAKLEKLIEDRELRIKFSQNAQININRFEKERVLNMWLDLLNSI